MCFVFNSSKKRAKQHKRPISKTLKMAFNQRLFSAKLSNSFQSFKH